MQNKHRIALLKACRIVGGQKQLAKEINIDSSRLNKWINRDKSIPLQYALAIESATSGQVTCYELLPDWENFVVYYQQFLKSKGLDDFLNNFARKICNSMMEKNHQELSRLDRNLVDEVIRCVTDELRQYFSIFEIETINSCQ